MAGASRGDGATTRLDPFRIFPPEIIVAILKLLVRPYYPLTLIYSLTLNYRLPRDPGLILHIAAF